MMCAAQLRRARRARSGLDHAGTPPARSRGFPNFLAAEETRRPLCKLGPGPTPLSSSTPRLPRYVEQGFSMASAGPGWAESKATGQGGGGPCR